jgi:hypothetical protein
MNTKELLVRCEPRGASKIAVGRTPESQPLAAAAHHGH